MGTPAPALRALESGRQCPGTRTSVQGESAGAAGRQDQRGVPCTQREPCYKGQGGPRRNGLGM
jgi:hypothetical protein